MTPCHQNSYHHPPPRYLRMGSNLETGFYSSNQIKMKSLDLVLDLYQILPSEPSHGGPSLPTASYCNAFPLLSKLGLESHFCSVIFKDSDYLYSSAPIYFLCTVAKASRAAMSKGPGGKLRSLSNTGPVDVPHSRNVVS